MTIVSYSPPMFSNAQFKLGRSIPQHSCAYVKIKLTASSSEWYSNFDLPVDDVNIRRLTVISNHIAPQGGPYAGGVARI